MADNMSLLIFLLRFKHKVVLYIFLYFSLISLDEGFRLNNFDTLFPVSYKKETNNVLRKKLYKLQNRNLFSSNKHIYTPFEPPGAALDDLTTKSVNAESYQFKAEVSRVMDIIVNSLYTDKDVFLRELISNAADACDKRKLLLQNKNAYTNQGGIRIKADKDKKLLIIEDEGVGMNKTELIQNLGTIAQSGTAKFLQQVKEGTADASSLIGQFGVGFYSAYLVADHVEVSSQRMDGDGRRYCWSSSAQNSGTFTVYEEDKDYESLFNKDEPGSRVVLHLKDDADEYLEDYKIKELLRKYSEFITYPIEIWSEKIEYERVPDESSVNKPSDTPKMKTITKRRHEWEHVNTQPPIWRRNVDEVKDEDYNDFYKSTFKAYDDPLGFIHFKVEGQVEFSCVLFVPGTVPWELTRNMFDEDSRSMRLYVKRVFINDKFTEAAPRWLTFIRGVVDSEDLPLNVGREMLQKSRMLSIINNRITTKAIDMFKNMRNQGGDKWKKLWENFGKYLKIGVIEDKEHQEDIASLLEFWTTKSGSDRRTLDGYIHNMQKNQTAIYYVAGETKRAASNAPALEQLINLGYEVLFCTEPVDEFCLQSLAVNKYKSFDLIDVNKADLKLPMFKKESESDSFEKKKIEYERLCDWLHALYGQKVLKVVVSTRLVDSPVVLVQGDFGLSPTMQRYIKQQASAQGMTENEMYGSQINQAVMEINPNHSVIQYLNEMVKDNKESDMAKERAHILYDVACLQGGYASEDPSKFSKSIIKLMQSNSLNHIIKSNDTTISVQ